MTTTRDSDNALILTDAFVYMADTGTTAPTDTTTALPAGWAEAGWLDTNGFTETPTGSTTALKGVNGATLAYVKGDDGWDFDFTMLESNDVTSSILYPNATSATATGVTTNTVKAATVPVKKAWVVELHYSNASKRRVVVPLGSAVVSGVASQYQDFRKFPVKVSAIQGSDGTLLVNITDNTAEAVA